MVISLNLHFLLQMQFYSLLVEFIELQLLKVIDRVEDREERLELLHRLFEELRRGLSDQTFCAGVQYRRQ
jgi:hypothetical protein